MIDSNLIGNAYLENRMALVNYFFRHLKNYDTAEDLTQDLFLRLLESKKEFRPGTLKNYIFTVARNLLNDYLRHLYVEREYISNSLLHHDNVDMTTESRIIANDLKKQELKIVHSLSHKRKVAYILHRFHEMNSKEISSIMNISKRTAENHLYAASLIVKSAMRMCS